MLKRKFQPPKYEPQEYKLLPTIARQVLTPHVVKFIFRQMSSLVKNTLARAASMVSLVENAYVASAAGTCITVNVGLDIAVLGFSNLFQQNSLVVAGLEV